jgi:FdhD protein
MEGRGRGQTRVRVRVVENGQVKSRRDVVATEEPLEIRLDAGAGEQSFVVTMRTPGNDFELAAGLLFAEGVITSRDDLRQISYCLGCSPEVQHYNIVTVHLRSADLFDAHLTSRQFGMTSACGLCGKERLDQVERSGIEPVAGGPHVSPRVIRSLPETLRSAQGLFEATGGLHAAALFETNGKLIAIREDVGRHNAVDKLLGWALLDGRVPLTEQIVMVSGRSSFEIAQKCAAAGVPILCAVSAPSSLAVDLAQRFNMTLVGFLRGDRFNVYHGIERLELSPPDA